MTKMLSAPGAPTTRATAASWVAVVLLVVASAAGALLAHARSGGANEISGPVIQDITITGMKFSPAQVEVDRSTPVVLRITNNDDRSHDLKIGTEYSGVIPAGKTVVHDFGTFTSSTQGWCTMASHKSRGMVYDVTVTG